MLPPTARRWLLSLFVALALSVSAAPVAPPLARAALAEAPAAQGRPTNSFEAWFDVEQPPTAPFEAVQLIVDFPPGARVGRHVHGGPGYITMLDGALTMTIGADPPRAYGPNESFVEPFRVVAEGANLEAVPASLIVTYLIPVGGAVTTLSADGGAPTAALPAGQLPPGAVPRFEARMRLNGAPAGYRVGQLLRSYPPGSWSRSEAATDPTLVTVVSGAVRVLTGASERVYGPKESWIEEPGRAYLSGNADTEPAVVAVSVIEAPQ